MIVAAFASFVPLPVIFLSLLIGGFWLKAVITQNEKSWFIHERPDVAQARMKLGLGSLLFGLLWGGCAVMANKPQSEKGKCVDRCMERNDLLALPYSARRSTCEVKCE